MKPKPLWARLDFCSDVNDMITYDCDATPQLRQNFNEPMGRALPQGFVFAPKHKANSYAKREGADVAMNMDEY